MNLHRHELVRFLQANPERQFKRCSKGGCPAAEWLNETNPGYAHGVEYNRVRVFNTATNEVTTEDAPKWLVEFVVGVDMGRGLHSYITSARALEVLQSVAA